MLRCPIWARCSDAVLLDFLMRVSPQIHPCLQSPGPMHDSLCVAAKLPILHRNITDCLSSHVIFLVQGSLLGHNSDIQNSGMPSIQLEKPTLLAKADVSVDVPRNGPHNVPLCPKVVQYLFFWLSKSWFRNACLADRRLDTEVYSTVLSLWTTVVSTKPAR